MPDPPPLVDIHCHLLPGVDDGPAGWDDTLAMARLAVADGISTIVVTPHQSSGPGRNSAEAIREQTAQLQQFLHRQEVPLRVLPGAEVRIDPDLADKLRGGELLSLADRRRHVLLELPCEIYLPLDRLLYELEAIGMTAILAHPERNLGILAQRHVLPPLVDAGCLLQVTAGSLTGAFGSVVQDCAEWLVAQRLVHFVGSDAHGVRSRRPLLRGAFERVARLAGYQAAANLCSHHPALVADGKRVIAPRRKPPATGLAGWFRRKRAG